MMTWGYPLFLRHRKPANLKEVRDCGAKLQKSSSFGNLSFERIMCSDLVVDQDRGRFSLPNGPWVAAMVLNITNLNVYWWQLHAPPSDEVALA